MDRHLAADQPVEADPADLRDHMYQPALVRLAPELPPPDFLTEGSFEVRDQGETGQCTGYALAHLVDLHRRFGTPEADRVSADMLYWMARRMEPQNTVQGDGVHSLRSVIKGFYHYGVCRQDTWRTDGASDCEGLDEAAVAASGCSVPIHDLTPDRAIEAQAITLGAYYRIRPYLNDYHAALTEAQAVLVSAEVHSGWHQTQVDQPDGGVIVPYHDGIGGHAFVLVGYTSRGFLVLNSWGKDWGGWNGIPGLALWPYEDWADRVMDAWVLRLGVPAPDAFAHSNRPGGISFGGFLIRSSEPGVNAAPSSACHQLLGHYAHLDDGTHVAKGSYASSRASVTFTADRLAAKSDPVKKQVVLKIPGSLRDLKWAFATEVANRPKIRNAGLYPYTLFWCNDVVEGAFAVLRRLIDEAIDRVGRDSPNLDATIERTCAGIGRAFWRDMDYGAELATRRGVDGAGDGDAAHLIDSFAAIPDVSIHLVAEGAGAILLAKYLSALRSGGQDRLKETEERLFAGVASLSLIAPTMGFKGFHKALGPLIRHLRAQDPQRVQLVLPSKEVEERLCVGSYSKSIMDLIVHSFARNDVARGLAASGGVGGAGEGGPGLVGMSLERWDTFVPPAPVESVRELVSDDSIHRVLWPQDLNPAELPSKLDQSKVGHLDQGLDHVYANITQLSLPTEEGKQP